VERGCTTQNGVFMAERDEIKMISAKISGSNNSDIYPEKTLRELWNSMVVDLNLGMGNPLLSASRKF